MFYCSRMHWVFRMPFVILSRILHYKVTCPLFGLGLFVNLLWKFFHPLWEGVFLGDAFHFILTTCQEPHDEFSHQRVPNSLNEKEINVFDYELEELISRKKCQVLKILLPFISYMHFKKKKKAITCWLFCWIPCTKICVWWLLIWVVRLLPLWWQIMMNSCCCLYCWRLTKVYCQIKGTIWMSLPHLWIHKIYSSRLTQLHIPTRTRYVENLVHSINILLM